MIEMTVAARDDLKDILDGSLVFDAHSDMLNDVVQKREQGQRNVIQTRHMPRLRAGGLTGQIFAIFVEIRFRPEKTLKRALQLLDCMHSELKESDTIRLCLNADDFAAARSEGKFAGLLGMEGVEPLEAHTDGRSFEESLTLLRLFHRLGVRCVGLTWQLRNMAADGAAEERTNGGLSRFGVELVKEIERMHILVDVAHLSQASFHDLLDIAEKPVICSHAACRALCDRPRNLTDEQIKELAAKDGVIGVMAFPTNVDDKDPSVEKVLDHVEHIVDLVGIDHVGFGADFADYIEWSPSEAGDDYVNTRPSTRGLEDVTKMPNLAMGLLSRGYSKNDLRKFLGENFLRVFERVL
jgi:membrane dipeptidase